MLENNLFRFMLKTQKEEMIDITNYVKTVVEEAGISSGICLVYTPHTTAAITINENADKDVQHDILLGLNKIVLDLEEFKHIEGNSTAHLKSSLFGASKTIIINNNSLVLGIWQGIYFCEFDGPRNREFYVKII